MTGFEREFEFYKITPEELHRIAYALEEAGFQYCDGRLVLPDYSNGDKFIAFVKGVRKRYNYHFKGNYERLRPPHIAAQLFGKEFREDARI